MKEFDDYDVKYPFLVMDIMDYFDISNGNIKEKSVLNFCEQYAKNHGIEMSEMQPSIIVKICDRLYSHDQLSLVSRNGIDGCGNNYLFVMKDKKQWDLLEKYMVNYYNSLVYGFEYIYRTYQKIVLPLVAYQNDEPHVGTCFRWKNGIVTARHCLTDGDKIAIKGYSADTLNNAKIFVSKNSNIDVAYILTNEETKIFSDEAHVLDEVLVMGYPVIPRFFDFCTAEKATISTISDRMTPSRGNVVAMANEIFTQNITKLMLITAKIRGGNSGGPVINKYGCVIGVSFSDAKGEGAIYDDLGYGIACPISVLEDIVKEKETLEVIFTDFPMQK